MFTTTSSFPGDSYLNGQQVRNLRVFRGWSQYRLAQLTGIAPGHLSRLENKNTKLRELKGETLERLAAELQVPVVCLITTVNDPRWLPLDFHEPGRAAEVMAEMAGARCILSLGHSLDSHLVPDEMAFRFAELEYGSWGIDEDRLADELASHRLYVQPRRVARRAKSYYLQVIGPESVLQRARLLNPQWLQQIDEEMTDKHIASCTLPGLIPESSWQRVLTLVDNTIPFPDWFKINIADDVLAVVWQVSGAHFTFDTDAVHNLRIRIESAACRHINDYSFVAWRDSRRMLQKVREANIQVRAFINRQFSPPVES